MEGQTWSIKQVDFHIYPLPCFVVTLGTFEEFLVHTPGQVAIEIRIRGRDTSNCRGVENDINTEFDLEARRQY